MPLNLKRGFTRMFWVLAFARAVFCAALGEVAMKGSKWRGGLPGPIVAVIGMIGIASMLAWGMLDARKHPLPKSESRPSADEVCSNLIHRYWYDGCKWRAESQMEKYDQVRSFITENHYTGLPKDGVEVLNEVYSDNGIFLDRDYFELLEEVYFKSAVTNTP